MGEDCSLKVWKDGAAIQTLVHPSTVWTVGWLPDTHDIVTGCADGIIRIWTKNHNRVASPSTISTYYKLLESRAAALAGKVGDISMDKLEGVESLKKAGSRDGENKIIRNGNVAECYSWSSQSQSWTKIGEVVDAVGQTHRQLLHGKEYDYVFDIDLGDESGIRKLGYNNGENPYVAAQDFIWKEQLQQYFLDEIASFITKKYIGCDFGRSYCF